MSEPAFGVFRETLLTSLPFQGLSDEEMARVLEACELVRTRKGESLLEEGMPGPGLFIVLQGSIECFLGARVGQGSRPTRVLFRREAAGDSFGEMSLIDQRPASASVRATDDTVVCLFPREAFHRITEEDDRIGRIVYRNLLEQLTQRLREKDENLDDIQFV